MAKKEVEDTITTILQRLTDLDHQYRVDRGEILQGLQTEYEATKERLNKLEGILHPHVAKPIARNKIKGRKRHENNLQTTLISAIAGDLLTMPEIKERLKDSGYNESSIANAVMVMAKDGLLEKEGHRPNTKYKVK